MEKTIIKATAIVALVSLSSLAYAANESSILLKVGSFSLANKTQNILGTRVFDTTSTGVLSVEYEKNMNNNLSWGVEYIGYENKYTPGSSNASSFHILANMRKYFEVSKHVLPYIGGGIGASGVRMSGSVTGSAGGFGVQAMAGIKFPFKSVSAIVEYKFISASPQDAANTSVDISGSGLFAGIGINF